MSSSENAHIHTVRILPKPPVGGAGAPVAIAPAPSSVQPAPLRSVKLYRNLSTMSNKGSQEMILSNGLAQAGAAQGGSKSAKSGRTVQRGKAHPKVRINSNIHSNINLFTTNHAEMQAQLKAVTTENGNLKRILTKLHREINELQVRISSAPAPGARKPLPRREKSPVAAALESSADPSANRSVDTIIAQQESAVQLDSADVFGSPRNPAQDAAAALDTLALDYNLDAKRMKLGRCISPSDTVNPEVGSINRMNRGKSDSVVLQEPHSGIGISPLVPEAMRVPAFLSPRDILINPASLELPTDAQDAGAAKKVKKKATKKKDLEKCEMSAKADSAGGAGAKLPRQRKRRKRKTKKEKKLEEEAVATAALKPEPVDLDLATPSTERKPSAAVAAGATAAPVKRRKRGRPRKNAPKAPSAGGRKAKQASALKKASKSVDLSSTDLFKQASITGVNFDPGEFGEVGDTSLALDSPSPSSYEPLPGASVSYFDVRDASPADFMRGALNADELAETIDLNEGAPGLAPATFQFEPEDKEKNILGSSESDLEFDGNTNFLAN